jgi:hypothetical protein
MSFRRFFKRTATSWRLERSEGNVDVNLTTLLGNVTPAVATTRANTWLANHAPKGELIEIHVYTVSPLRYALYRATVTGPDTAIPANWWAE